MIFISFTRLINSNAGPILHHLATVHLWQRNGQKDEWQPCQQLDHYWSTVGWKLWSRL